MKRVIFLLAVALLIGGCSSTSVYFCPEDNCRGIVLGELGKAQESIYFMMYSFTDNDVAGLLIDKSEEGINVEGVVESQGMSGESEYRRLLDRGISVKKDKNKYLMHNKVWIIDGKIVLTGSANTSKNGYERNNDNIVVIKDKQIAEQYLEEFYRLYEN